MEDTQPQEAPSLAAAEAPAQEPQRDPAAAEAETEAAEVPGDSAAPVSAPPQEAPLATALAPATPVGPAPLNPFESTFHMLTILRDEIKGLKEEVEDLRTNTDERFKKVEADRNTSASTTTSRLESLDKFCAELKDTMTDKFKTLASTMAKMGADKQVQLDKLQRDLSNEAADALGRNKHLAARMQSEVLVLKERCDRTDGDLESFRQRVESALAQHRRTDEDLRQDVEKLAALFSQNSMAADPFEQLGYKLETSARGLPWATAHGGSLPPLKVPPMGLPSPSRAAADGQSAARLAS